MIFEVGAPNLTERGSIVTDIFTINNAFNIITNSRAQNMNFQDLPSDLKNAVKIGIIEAEKLFQKIYRIFNRKIQGIRLNIEEIRFVRNIVKHLTIEELKKSSYAIFKNELSGIDKRRIEITLETIKNYQISLNELKKGNKIIESPVKYKEIKIKFNQFQKNLFFEWVEDVNAISDFGDEHYAINWY